MKTEKLKEITDMYLEFHPLHQKKISSLFSKSYDDGYGCNKNQIRAIMIIGRNINIIPTTLGKCLGLQKGSLTTLLDSLEDMNLIKREPCTDDRRKTLVSLTDSGKTYRDLKLSEFAKDIYDLFSSLTYEELSEFASNLKGVISIFKKI